MTTYCKSCGCSLPLGGPVCGECILRLGRGERPGVPVTRAIARRETLLGRAAIRRANEEREVRAANRRASARGVTTSDAPRGHDGCSVRPAVVDMADESGEDMVTRHMAGADDLSDDIEF